jgi:hypothetical protein
MNEQFYIDNNIMTDMACHFLLLFSPSSSSSIIILGARIAQRYSHRLRAG